MNSNPNDSIIARAEKYAGIESAQIEAIPDSPAAETYDIYVKVDSPEQVGAYTVVLSSMNPNQLLLPKDPCRKRAVVVAVDGPVVLSGSLEESQDPRNASTATGLAASGFVLPQGLPGLVVEDEAPLWVSLVGDTALRVSVIVERYEQN